MKAAGGSVSAIADEMARMVLGAPPSAAAASGLPPRNDGAAGGPRPPSAGKPLTKAEQRRIAKRRAAEHLTKIKRFEDGIYYLQERLLEADKVDQEYLDHCVSVTAFHSASSRCPPCVCGVAEARSGRGIVVRR